MASELSKPERPAPEFHLLEDVTLAHIEGELARLTNIAQRKEDYPEACGALGALAVVLMRHVRAQEAIGAKSSPASSKHTDTLEALLQSCADYLENYSDVVDGAYGEPSPNFADGRQKAHRSVG